MSFQTESKWKQLHQEILQLLKDCGRTPEELSVVGASKLQSAEAVSGLFHAGLRDFGENYLQEAQKKQQELAHLDIRWHFIGSIQSNKAKDLVGRFYLIHSVDRLKVAEKISAEAVRRNLRQKILIEVNLAEESSKSGVLPSEIFEFTEEVLKLPGLEVRGLMTMPPLEEDIERSRKYFRQARVLLEDLRSRLSASRNKSDLEGFKELSMGTSSDFRVAIEEGATIIRLGTVVFGPRPKKEG